MLGFVVWPPEFMDEDNAHCPFTPQYETDDEDYVPLSRIRVRRGSEGYEVRIITAQDRQNMLESAMQNGEDIDTF